MIMMMTIWVGDKTLLLFLFLLLRTAAETVASKPPRDNYFHSIESTLVYCGSRWNLPHPKKSSTQISSFHPLNGSCSWFSHSGGILWHPHSKRSSIHPSEMFGSLPQQPAPSGIRQTQGFPKIQLRWKTMKARRKKTRRLSVVTQFIGHGWIPRSCLFIFTVNFQYSTLFCFWSLFAAVNENVCRANFIRREEQVTHLRWRTIELMMWGTFWLCLEM